MSKTPRCANPACRRRLYGSNRCGYCYRCKVAHSCTICRRVLPGQVGPKKWWCDACIASLATFRFAIESFAPCPRPDPETLAERLALYERRAANLEPLFS